MRINARKAEAGIAIIIVMVSVFVLAMLAAAFAYSMKVETKLVINANNESEMEWIGRSGIEQARWILGQELTLPGDGQRFDALKQRWAGGSGESNEVLASTPATVQIGRGSYTVLPIIDNERKFNINSVLGNEAILQQALILIGADAAEVPGIIGSVQDWLDRDEDIHLGGAESSYYQTLQPPYFAKNGTIDDLKELLLVKGIAEHPELYWGNLAPTRRLSLFQAQRRPGQGAMGGTAPMPIGLVDLFTPVSSGRVNINTASASTLQLLGIEKAAAEQLVSSRQGPDGVDGTDDDAPFNSPGEVVNVMPQQAANAILPYLTTRSSTFEAQVDVEIGSAKRRYFALLRRNSGQDVQILSIHWREGDEPAASTSLAGAPPK